MLYKLSPVCNRLGMREKYPSDLTDKEWAFLEPLIPGDAKLGRPPRYCKREIANAIFYLVRSGCAWRMMPHDLPPWRICYHYFSKWKHAGVWEAIHDRLRDIVRTHHGKKKPQPLRLWTRRVLKQLITEESVAMMRANASSEGRGTFSWTASG